MMKADRLGHVYRHAPWLRICAAWAAVGFFDWVHYRLPSWQMHTQPISLAWLCPDLASIALWALVTPGLFWLTLRTARAGRPQLAPSVALHVVAYLAVSAADTRLTYFIVGEAVGIGHRPFFTMYCSQLFIDGFSYVCVITIAYVTHYSRLYYGGRLRAAELEAELTRAQLQALEMQLRPHFFFNTLHSIGSLIRAARPAEALEMVAGLGDLMRVVIRRAPAQEISLAQELQWIERYLQIEQIRFGDRLRIRVVVERDLDEALVPAFILQPLVENALRHGIETDEGAGLVTISAQRKVEELQLTVYDSGSGPAAGDRDGIGLSNTRARLRRLYGDGQRLEVTRAAGGGAIAQLAIPLRRAAREPS